EVLDSLNEKLLGEDSDSPVAETARDLQSTMASLKDAAARTNLLLQRSSPALESALDDVSQLTATLAEQRDAIGQILANADTLSQQLVDAELNAVIADVQETIQQLSATLGTTNEAMAGVNDLVGKVQQGEGTLGKLMTDEALYQNLSELTYSLDSLMADLQERPYRYFPLKSRRRVNRYDQQDANNQ
ncbi:MAG: hypothetical protein KDC54_03645, partial [Lewinella sp.]|nr:hypothetical protein [Lewinella sp.]